MAVPKTKEELLAAIKNDYHKLVVDLKRIPEEVTSIQSLEGHAKGTQMSICNLVSYLIGWGELVLKWDKLKKEGVEVDFPETGYKWNELGKLAQHFYTIYDDTYPKLLAQLENTVECILLLIEEHTQEELYETPWYDKWSKGKMIQLNTSSPYKNARARVRKWIKLNKEHYTFL